MLMIIYILSYLNIEM